MNDEEIASFITAVILLSILSGLIWGVLTFVWRSAEVEARIYNEKFETKYVARDFFYAGTEIKKLHEEKIPNRPNQNNLNGELTVNLKK